MSKCKAGCEVVLEDQDVQLDSELCNKCTVIANEAAEELNDLGLQSNHPLTDEPFDDEGGFFGR